MPEAVILDPRTRAPIGFISLAEGRARTAWADYGGDIGSVETPATDWMPYEDYLYGTGAAMKPELQTFYDQNDGAKTGKTLDEFAWDWHQKNHPGAYDMNSSNLRGVANPIKDDILAAAGAVPGSYLSQPNVQSDVNAGLAAAADYDYRHAQTQGDFFSDVVLPALVFVGGAAAIGALAGAGVVAGAGAAEAGLGGMAALDAAGVSAGTSFGTIAQGALEGGLKNAAVSVVTGRDPGEGFLSGVVSGGIGSVAPVIDTGLPAPVNAALTGAATAAVAGGNPIIGATLGGGGSLLNSGLVDAGVPRNAASALTRMAGAAATGGDVLAAGASSAINVGLDFARQLVDDGAAVDATPVVANAAGDPSFGSVLGGGDPREQLSTAVPINTWDQAFTGAVPEIEDTNRYYDSFGTEYTSQEAADEADARMRKQSEAANLDAGLTETGNVPTGSIVVDQGQTSGVPTAPIVTGIINSALVDQPDTTQQSPEPAASRPFASFGSLGWTVGQGTGQRAMFNDFDAMLAQYGIANSGGRLRPA